MCPAAWQSKGAWIDFRDGLDAMDTARFPEATYGELVLGKPQGSMTGGGVYPSVSSSSKNTQRALAICAAHAAHRPHVRAAAACSRGGGTGVAAAAQEKNAALP